MQAAVLDGWAAGWFLVSNAGGTALQLICPSALVPAGGSTAAAASLSFQAAQLAGVDELSKPYIGPDIPAEIKGKRDYLFQELSPEQR